MYMFSCSVIDKLNDRVSWRLKYFLCFQINGVCASFQFCFPRFSYAGLELHGDL